MTIDDVLDVPDLSPNDAVKGLQSRRLFAQTDLKKAKSEYYVYEHDVFSKKKRPDKVINLDDGHTKVEYVSRVGLALQHIIVERAVAFLFGNEVKLMPSKKNGGYDTLMTAITRINKDNKIDSFNRQVARALFTCTEVAEYWYSTDTDKNDNYGFNSTTKFKCALFSPLKGDTLYPYFDEYGDLIAFSRMYTLPTNTGKTVQMFETWTDEEYKRYVNDGGWKELAEEYKKLETGKIPIVYANQLLTEWHRVQSLIDRLEKLLSNFADTNDYFASPLLFINGQIESFASKGEAGKIIQGDEKATAQYLAWSALPEPIKMEVDNLLQFIFGLSQTPDISFASVKGMGTNISGETLKMLFLDAHLKVQNKLEIFDSYLTRRYNIIKAELKQINSKLPIDLDIDNVIVPYMSNVESTTMTELIAAVDNGLISKDTARQNIYFIDDAQAEEEKIEAEDKEIEDVPPTPPVIPTLPPTPTPEPIPTK